MVAEWTDPPDTYVDQLIDAPYLNTYWRNNIEYEQAHTHSSDPVENVVRLTFSAQTRSPSAGDLWKDLTTGHLMYRTATTTYNLSDPALPQGSKGVRKSGTLSTDIALRDHTHGFS